MRTMILLAALAAMAPASAQADCPDVPTHVLLARQCVSERGWRTETNDCAAIYETALEHSRVTGLSVRESICELSSHLLDDERDLDRRAWLQDLDADGHRPAGLGAPWTTRRCDVARVWVDGAPTCPGAWLPSRREAWETTLREAESRLAGGVPPVCSSPPRTWGSDQDLRRRRLAGYGWEEVDCGYTANHFGSLRAPRSR